MLRPAHETRQVVRPAIDRSHLAATDQQQPCRLLIHHPAQVRQVLDEPDVVGAEAPARLAARARQHAQGAAPRNEGRGDQTVHAQGAQEREVLGIVGAGRIGTSVAQRSVGRRSNELVLMQYRLG